MTRKWAKTWVVVLTKQQRAAPPTRVAMMPFLCSITKKIKKMSIPNPVSIVSLSLALAIAFVRPWFKTLVIVPKM